MYKISTICLKQELVFPDECDILVEKIYLGTLSSDNPKQSKVSLWEIFFDTFDYTNE